MIWWYLAGFVSGAVGWHLLIQWIGRKIVKKQQMEAFKSDRKP